jgi:hypothetical protein
MPPGWVNVSTAAERLGVSQRHIQQLCNGQWAEQGLARLARPAHGGKACWFISIAVLKTFVRNPADGGAHGRSDRWRSVEIRLSNQRRWAAYRRRREGR